MDDKLLDAIRELNKTIDDLSLSLGRGVSAGRTGGVNRGATGIGRGVGRGVDQAMDSMVKRFDAKISKTVKALDQSRSLQQFEQNLGKSASAVQDHAQTVKKSAADERKSAKERAEATKDLVRGVKDFGLGLLMGGSKVEEVFGSLAAETKYAARSGNKFAGVLNTLAMAAGFTIGTMSKFAETAQSAAGMVDLSVIRVGTITLAKNFSSLGKSFIALVNESGGSFRVFGGTTREALENLSELSRGLRLGSSAVKKSMLQTLGKETVKDFDRASEATAALGLTQEEQAKLQASIMQSVRLGAKNEADAQRMLVKEYANTAESIRKISNQMGISAKELADAIAKFKTSIPGQLIGLKGIKGAEEVFGYLKQLMPGVSEDTLQRMAIDAARGQGQAALAAVGGEYQPTGQVFMRAIEQARRMEGGLTQENISKALKDNAKTMEETSKRLTGEAGEGQTAALSVSLLGSVVDPAIAGEVFAKRMQETNEEREKREKEERKKAGKTEADNVKSMSDLVDSLDRLRGSIQWLTGTILGIGGALALFGTSAAGIALFKGFMKGLMGWLGRGTAGKAAGGLFAMMSGRAALGAAGAVGTGAGITTAAGSLATLGTGAAGAGLLATIGSAITGLFKEGGLIRRVGSGIAGMFKEGGLVRRAGSGIVDMFKEDGLVRRAGSGIAGMFKEGGLVRRAGSGVVDFFKSIGKPTDAAKGMTTAADYLSSLDKKSASKGIFDSIKSTISGAFKEGGLVKNFVETIKGKMGIGAPGPLSTGGIVPGGIKGAAEAAQTGLLSKYGSSLVAGSLGKALWSGAKGFGIGAIGGMIGDMAADALGRETKAGAAADVAGTAASYAGMGAMIGSIIPGLGTAIGAGIGGLVGLGSGLWSNASTLFGSKTPDLTSGVDQADTEQQPKAETRTGNSDVDRIMNYLAIISTDIAAIRSNTRGDNATVPVRLG